MRARVVAASVQVVVGGRVHLCPRDADLPTGVPAETIERLVAKGLVEEYEVAEYEVAEEEAAGYGHLKVDELKALIGARNADRDPAQALPTEGKKADLVAILEADDAATEQQ